MPQADDWIAHCLELLAPLGAPRARRMFGGQGFYVDELFVAVGAGEQLYLKVDDETRGRFEAEGGQPFVVDSRGKLITMGFCSVPAEAMESPSLMRPWGRLALQAALRARQAKAPAKQSRKTAAKPAAAKTAATKKAAAKKTTVRTTAKTARAR
jgi:DNA transformation protein